MLSKLPVGDRAYPLLSSTSAAPQSLSVIIRHIVFWCTCGGVCGCVHAVPAARRATRPRRSAAEQSTHRRSAESRGRTGHKGSSVHARELSARSGRGCARARRVTHGRCDDPTRNSVT
jgi:hypothetical protein